MNYIFDETEVLNLANMLAEAPFKYAEPVISYIKNICEPQTKAFLEEQKKEKEKAKAPASEK